MRTMVVLYMYGHLILDVEVPARVPQDHTLRAGLQPVHVSTRQWSSIREQQAGAGRDWLQQPACQRAAPVRAGRHGSTTAHTYARGQQSTYAVVSHEHLREWDLALLDIPPRELPHALEPHWVHRQRLCRPGRMADMTWNHVFPDSDPRYST
jgi:hypothetical protein